jgi:hypothetical protein
VKELGKEREERRSWGEEKEERENHSLIILFHHPLCAFY